MNTQTSNKKVSKFTNSWWNDFETQTENFSKHSLFKNAFNSEEVTYINKLVEDVIKKVTSDEKRQSYLRIWKNGKYNKSKSKFFKKNPIGKNESILEWKKRLFNDDKFGLFLNNANSHSEELSALLHDYLKPYFDEYGMPTNGFSTTIILGDYGWTPLGIHRDNIGEHIIHFHLGPGEKDIYIWDKEKSDKYGYVDFKRTENFDDFINDYSHKTSFKTGDIFSMLGKNVHIGNTHEFSIGLVVEFNGLTEKEFLRKMWFNLGNDLFHKNFKGDKAKILPAYTESSHSDYLNFLYKGIKHFNIDTGHIIKDALKNKCLDHKYTLLSNNGFLLSPYVDNIKIKKKYKKIGMKSSIKLMDTYKILYYTNDNEINLFIRGVKFKTQNNPEVISFVDKLNTGGVLIIEEIKNNFFDNWDKSAVFKLLYVFYKLKGLKIQF